MKNSIIIGLFLLSVTAFANKSNERGIKEPKTESKIKVVDICSITETREIGNYTVTITAVATTCEEVQTKLNSAFSKAQKVIAAAS
jgi:hypothetical protein